MHRAGGVADFQREAGGHHDLAGRGDVGELRLHLRALVFQLQRIDADPGLAVFLDDDFHHAQDHALLGGREIAPLDPGLELADAAVERVDDAEHQRGLAHDQSAAAQRPDGDDVEVGGHRQFAQEGAVALHRHRANRNLGAAANEVEEADAEVAREPFVDDFHRRHPAADDPLLAGDIVVADRAGIDFFLGRLLAFAGDALQKGIDLFLRQK